MPDQIQLSHLEQTVYFAALRQGIHVLDAERVEVLAAISHGHASKLLAGMARKGRDIYDLAQIGALNLDERALRKLTLYYFYHAKMIFHYPTFRANVAEKLRYRGFADDVRGLIRTNQQFDWQQASQAVLERFAFLGDLDVGAI